jgi:hypothetical protein
MIPMPDRSQMINDVFDFVTLIPNATKVVFG